jgi:hypothetical protein
MLMTAQKISFMPNHMRYLLLLFILAGSLLTPASHFAYAHTFSSSESAEFLSLVDQIRAETQLVTMNLENNNVTLAQAHAQKAVVLLDNFTISEIRERNNRIADSLVSGLGQLEANVTSLTSDSQEQIPQGAIQDINESVMSLNDIISEAETVRVESDQQNNSTMWALVLADLVNTVLADYGNATGAPFDLTDMSNLAGMEGIEMDHVDNNMTMMMGDEQMQISGNSSEDSMAMEANSNSSMSNTTLTIIVDEAAYQSAQYISNNTILQLFTDTLKPLTISANETSLAETGNETSFDNSSTSMTQEGVQSSTPDNNVTSNIDALEERLIQLRDDIADKATPIEVMTTAHVHIHPLLMQMYGLTIVAEEGQGEHTDHIEG